MDEFDRKATEKIADHAFWWDHDTIYPGSRVLTEMGRALRDRLAEEYRNQPAKAEH